jgi:hypothetical protein
MTSRRTRAFLTLAAVLALAVVAVALSGPGRNGPSLKPWHTEDLTAEFTAEMLDQIRTFDDYKQLEDRLFAELKAKVYASTGTGPAYALVRYSAGSASDPEPRKPNWNRSFEMPADRPRRAVLLLHGMSDSPYSLRALGEALNRRGYSGT